MYFGLLEDPAVNNKTLKTH